jgi:hypothetical protein
MTKCLLLLAAACGSEAVTPTGSVDETDPCGVALCNVSNVVVAVTTTATLQDVETVRGASTGGAPSTEAACRPETRRS